MCGGAFAMADAAWTRPMELLLGVGDGGRWGGGLHASPAVLGDAAVCRATTDVTARSWCRSAHRTSKCDLRPTRVARALCRSPPLRRSEGNASQGGRLLSQHTSAGIRVRCSGWLLRCGPALCEYYAEYLPHRAECQQCHGTSV